MPSRHRLLVVTSAGVVGLVIAPPAAAAEATTASVTLTGGSLTMTVPPAAGSLGTRANTVAGGAISGSLGQVQVNDARSAAAGSGWVATVPGGMAAGQYKAVITRQTVSIS